MNRAHLFLTVTQTQTRDEKRRSCTVWLPIEFHGFTSRINSKGYHSLVPGLISFFKIWYGSLKIICITIYSVPFYALILIINMLHNSFSREFLNSDVKYG